MSTGNPRPMLSCWEFVITQRGGCRHNVFVVGAKDREEAEAVLRKEYAYHMQDYFITYAEQRATRIFHCMDGST